LRPLNLDKSLDLKDTRINILDYNGKTVIEQELNNKLTPISVKDLPTGLYILEVISPTYRGIKKIIIQ